MPSAGPKAPSRALTLLALAILAGLVAGCAGDDSQDPGLIPDGGGLQVDGGMEGRVEEGRNEGSANDSPIVEAASDAGDEADGSKADESLSDVSSEISLDATLVDAATGDVVTDAPVDAASDGHAGEGGAPSSTTCGRPILGSSGLGDADGRIWDLGHDTGLVALSNTSTRVLSTDRDAHWVLWNVADHSVVQSGDLSCVSPTFPCNSHTELVGSTVAVRALDTVELRSAVDGTLMASVATSASQLGLSSDGSYLWAADAAGVSAWSATSGTLLTSQAGNYAAAKVFAATGELRIATGPAGTQVIEALPTSGAPHVVSDAFLGNFAEWFTGGEHFITTLTNTSWLYSKAATKEALLDGTGVHGTGGYFWINTMAGLQVYKVSQPMTPVSTLQVLGSSWSGDMIAAVPYGTPAVDVVELKADGIAQQHFDLHVPYVDRFSADEAGHWALSNQLGVMYWGSDLLLSVDASPLSCGGVLATAGSLSGRAAISTEGAGTMVFDLGPGSKVLAATVRFPSSHLELSTDGMLLAAGADVTGAQYSPYQGLKIYSLPAMQELHTFAYDYFSSYTMSAAGNRIGIRRQQSGQVTDILEMQTFLTNNGATPFLFSPDGTHFTTDQNRIYDNGVLSSAVPGTAIGWLDSGRLLANQTRFVNRLGDVYDHAQIFDAAGNPGATSPLPQLSEFIPVSATSIFSVTHDAVYDLGTGAVVWQGPSSTAAAAMVGARVMVIQSHYLVVVDR